MGEILNLLPFLPSGGSGVGLNFFYGYLPRETVLRQIQDKASLRNTFIRRRLALSETEQIDLARQATAHLSAWPTFSPLKQVALYASVRAEISTEKCRAWLQERGVTIYFPRVRQTPPVGLEFVAVAKPQDMQPGPFGVLEPPAKFPAVPLAQIPLLLVPGVVFDRQGHRIGWGQGYYDRILRGYSGVRVGFAYEFQVLEEIPHEPWDEAVDFLVTEAGLHPCSRP